jgi:hypothetical protein
VLDRCVAQPACSFRPGAALGLYGPCAPVDGLGLRLLRWSYFHKPTLSSQPIHVYVFYINKSINLLSPYSGLQYLNLDTEEQRVISYYTSPSSLTPIMVDTQTYLNLDFSYNSNEPPGQKNSFTREKIRHVKNCLG